MVERTAVGSLFHKEGSKDLDWVAAVMMGEEWGPADQRNEEGREKWQRGVKELDYSELQS